MFEKIGRIAEQTAMDASRRQFLGQLGRAALATAAALSGVIAFPEVVQAQKVGHCGKNSVPACVGKRVGFRCGGGGRFVQTCQGAPDCICA